MSVNQLGELLSKVVSEKQEAMTNLLQNGINCKRRNW